MRTVLALLFLCGCAGGGLRFGSPASYDGSPIARATNGASATFSMTTCAPSTERARLVEETILQLNQQGVLASADGSGTQVRVTLNLCGQGPAPAATTARRS